MARAETIGSSATDANSSAADGEVFAPVSAEYLDEAETTPEDTPRLLARAAYRVAELSDGFGDWVADKRTAGELGTDVKDHATELAKGASEYGKQRLQAAGGALTRGVVRFVTAPGRLAESGVDKARSGLEKLEQRAQSAEARKMERVVNRGVRRNIKQQVKEDLGYQKQVKREIKREAKDTKKHEAFMQKQAEQIQRASAAQARKQQRRESRAAWRSRQVERVAKPARQVKRVGGAVVRGTVDVGTGLAALGMDAGREALEVGGELYGKASKKAAEARTTYHVSRGHAAARKAEGHLNKTTTSEGESYKVTPVYEDGKN